MFNFFSKLFRNKFQEELDISKIAVKNAFHDLEKSKNDKFNLKKDYLEHLDTYNLSLLRKAEDDTDFELQGEKEAWSNILLFNEHNQFLVLQRSAEDDFGSKKWCLPGGGIEESESIHEAGLRELKEETNLHIDYCISAHKEVVNSGVIFYSIAYINTELNPDLQIVLDKEHDNWDWVYFDELDEEEYPFLLDTKDHIKYILGKVTNYGITSFEKAISERFDRYFDKYITNLKEANKQLEKSYNTYINKLEEFDTFNKSNNVSENFRYFLDGSLGKLRSEMPQINEDNVDDFILHFHGQSGKGDTKVKKEVKRIGDIRFTQGEIDENKVMNIATSGNINDQKYILSSDGYLLDGHHRASAMIMIDPDTEVTVYRILNLPIKELLRRSKLMKLTRKNGIGEDNLSKERVKKGKKANIGEVRQFKDGLYKKYGQDDWRPYSEADSKSEDNSKNEAAENFDEWFGDSVIKDENGKPKVLYHGSDYEFSKFAEQKTADGFFFTDDKEQAEGFGENIYPVYLKMENPADLRDPFRFFMGLSNDQKETLQAFVDDQFEGDWEYFLEQASSGQLYEMGMGRLQNDLMAELQGVGFDSVIMPDAKIGGGIADSYIVFEPTKIKSADKNSGEYDEDNANIYKSKFDKVMEEYSEGTLKDSGGNKVTDKDRALAIAYSESEKSESDEIDKSKKFFDLAEKDNEFFEYVISNNKDDRDVGELQDISEEEQERLLDEYYKSYIKKSDNNQTLAVDFDGVIHKYSKRWHDGTIYDEPIEGAKEALQKLKDKGHEIVIYSTRCFDKYIDGELQKNQIDDVEVWLSKYQIPYDRIATEGKPMADYFIDDSAIEFNGDWQEILGRLMLGDVLDINKGKSDIPNYKKAEGEKNCGNCGAYFNGYCNMYDALVQYDYVCDNWVSLNEYTKKK